MNDKTKSDIEKLETLRDLALCGPEDGREEAHRAYEELREKLFSAAQCATPDEADVTKELHDGR